MCNALCSTRGERTAVLCMQECCGGASARSAAFARSRERSPAPQPSLGCVVCTTVLHVHGHVLGTLMFKWASLCGERGVAFSAGGGACAHCALAHSPRALSVSLSGRLLSLCG
mmetsp:Transcript_21391/g.56364  ORF Transcript_21391/g.56364 Transcript_21391/m.56364 type:complete len:113 (-) Transcript_21391:110-448(-)|eukprot:431544-Prymnesium_polylepis.1